MTERNDYDPEENDDVYVIDESDLEPAEMAEPQGTDGGEPAVESRQSSASDADELERLREENEKLRNDYLRSRADFENYRKRMERDKADFRKYALASSIEEILPVVDNLERALESRSDESGDDFRKGVELIHKQLGDVLRKLGVSPIEEAGVPFDPTLHEAITREESDLHPPNTVVDVLRKGYVLNDRLLRPAMVRVSAESSPGGEERSGEEARD